MWKDLVEPLEEFLSRIFFIQGQLFKAGVVLTLG